MLDANETPFLDKDYQYHARKHLLPCILNQLENSHFTRNETISEERMERNGVPLSTIPSLCLTFLICPNL
jgi:hypothetical protein